MYVCIYIHMHVHIHICMYAHMYVHTYIYVCMHICMSFCMSCLVLITCCVFWQRQWDTISRACPELSNAMVESDVRLAGVISLNPLNIHL